MTLAKVLDAQNKKTVQKAVLVLEDGTLIQGEFEQTERSRASLFSYGDGWVS